MVTRARGGVLVEHAGSSTQQQIAAAQRGVRARTGEHDARHRVGLTRGARRVQMPRIVPAVAVLVGQPRWP
jgi:hypothetical protein